MAPETENVGPGEIEYVSVDMRCRPRRPLILVDSSRGWPVVLEAIRFASCLWGGWYSAIAPADPALLEPMLPILRVFDPDDVFGVGFSEADSDTEDLLASYLNPFIEIGEMVRCNVSSGLVAYGYCNLRKSIRQLELTSTNNLKLECEDPLAAWIYSHIGLLPEDGGGSSDDDDELTLHVTEDVLTADELGSDTSRIAEFAKMPWDTPSRPYYPFGIGLKKLNYWTMVGASVFQPSPTAVMGEDIADFCLYYTLARLRPGVFWLPWGPTGPPRYSESGTDHNLRALYTAWALNESYRASSPASRAAEVHLVSMSLDVSSLANMLQELREDVPVVRPVRRSLLPRACHPGDVRALVPRISRVWEEDYRPPQYVPVRQGVAQTALGTPSPEFHAEPLAGKHAWAIECALDHWSCVPTAGCVVEEGRPSGVVTPARAGRGTVSYPAFHNAIFGGTPVGGSLHRPRLILPNALAAATAMFRTHDISIELSDKGGYERDFIAAFGGLEQAAGVLRDDLQAAVLQKFTDDSPNQECVFDQGTLCHNKLRYLDALAVQTIAKQVLDEDSLPEWDNVEPVVADWLGRGVLSRGYILKCSYCLYADWYHIEEVSDTFRCKRCRASNDYLPCPEITWSLYEPVRMVINHNSHVPILSMDSIRRWSPRRFICANALGLEGGDGDIPGDLDMFAIVEGEVWIGEAKKRGGIQQEELARLKNIARILCPDVLVLATGAASWDDGQVEDNFRPLATELIAIGTQLITMSQDDLYNPAGFGSRMRDGKFLPDPEPTD